MKSPFSSELPAPYRYIWTYQRREFVSKDYHKKGKKRIATEEREAAAPEHMGQHPKSAGTKAQAEDASYVETEQD